MKKLMLIAGIGLCLPLIATATVPVMTTIHILYKVRIFPVFVFKGDSMGWTITPPSDFGSYSRPSISINDKGFSAVVNFQYQYKVGDSHWLHFSVDDNENTCFYALEGTPDDGFKTQEIQSKGNYNCGKITQVSANNYQIIVTNK